MNTNEKTAWLAGFWDGEGSVGIRLDSRPDRGHRPYYLVAQVQFSTTSKEALDFAISVLAEINVTGIGYTYQERDPERQKDAYYCHVRKLGDIRTMCNAVIPYAVLKRRQWEIMRDYVDSRLEGITLRADGTMPRGGNRPARPFSPFEIECARQLWLLNNRGPNMEQRYQEWTEKIQTFTSP